MLSVRNEIKHFMQLDKFLFSYGELEETEEFVRSRDHGSDIIFVQRKHKLPKTSIPKRNQTYCHSNKRVPPSESIFLWP